MRIRPRQVAGRPGLRRLLLLFTLLSLASCSDRSLELFFDIPPPTPQEQAAAAVRAEANKKAQNVAPAPTTTTTAAVTTAAAQPVAAAQPAAKAVAQSTSAASEARPAIEKILDWKKARKLLPKDVKGRRGRVNWTKAVREGIIKPRESIDGSPRSPSFVFRYDFFIPSTDAGFEAYFPHSTHTEWVACESCHPRIFPVRDMKFSKKLLKKGKLCGVCHAKKGGPAFWLRSCDRCHPNAS